MHQKKSLLWSDSESCQVMQQPSGPDRRCSGGQRTDGQPTSERAVGGLTPGAKLVAVHKDKPTNELALSTAP